jgi:hypothetical protein
MAVEPGNFEGWMAVFWHFNYSLRLEA